MRFYQSQMMEKQLLRVVKNMTKIKIKVENPKEKRPWGEIEILYQEPGLIVKRLFVDSGHRLSLQSHKNRDEIWLLLSGDCSILLEDKVEKMEINKANLISRGQKHRLIGGTEGSKILEVGFGEYSDEDIIRYEDDYGRT